MNNSSPNFKEVYGVAQEWASRTDQILLKKIKELGIGVTHELYQSLRSQVYSKASEIIGIDLSFLLRGRFRDMGVGRMAKIESQATNGEIIRSKTKGRKPAKFYSRPFYGRLHALNGVVSSNLVEQSIRAVAVPLNSLNQ